MEKKLRSRLQNVVAGVIATVTAGILVILMTGKNLSFHETSTSSQVTKPSWVWCEGYVALTFDDGPNPDSTHKILKQLDAYGMQATFFAIGEHVKQFPKLAKEIVASGNVLENHTYEHPDLGKLDSAEIRDSLAKTQTAIGSVTGNKPEFYRPPYGSTSAKVSATAAQQGLTEVGWTLDTNDWKKDNWSVSALKRTFAQVKSGDIVLMHDAGYSSTVDVIPVIAEILQSKKLCPGKIVKSTLPMQTWEGWSFSAKAGAWREH